MALRAIWGVYFFWRFNPYQTKFTAMCTDQKRFGLDDNLYILLDETGTGKLFSDLEKLYKYFDNLHDKFNQQNN